ncbi:CpaD family pilus assembly protein [Mesorhizobium retamae]|uniref:CpaD family pilus assembly protein n=1 Tax=Mesorhizobium retamae TaxID=2912854 RepID=A0ABS9QG27_9HYPH|nr:CpaD family pilus assembly protein [Mesorhizobium sp. IRAMC:0171]MCG7506380.1 CpaD family pilus assembly protein [Mesorhizobium sp. IRAMC:0171]
MSHSARNQVPQLALHGSKMVMPALLLAITLLGGCANRDSVTVGAIPDDYRTNHPIMISQQDKTLDIPVGASDRDMTRAQKESLLGFLEGYDRAAASVVTISVPTGSANEIAAQSAARGFAKVAAANGVRRDRIAFISYDAGGGDIAAPVRVTYSALRAHTDKCGRWSADIADTTENKHYTNFGCSYQNNLAAQIANPNDLLGPRQQTPVDATRRGVVIDGYRKAPFYTPVPRQEVDY